MPSACSWPNREPVVPEDYHRPPSPVGYNTLEALIFSGGANFQSPFKYRREFDADKTPT